MGKEKRKSERKPLFEVCRYNIDGREYADLSTNISEKGIFIKNTVPPPIGTPIVLTVTLPEQWGKLPLQIIGRVAWINDSQDIHQRGMGIEFQSVFANSEPIIQYFISEVYNKGPYEEAKLKQEQDSEAGQTTYHYNLKDESESEGS